jgi:hypothetical protein
MYLSRLLHNQPPIRPYQPRPLRVEASSEHHFFRVLRDLNESSGSNQLAAQVRHIHISRASTSPIQRNVMSMPPL